MILSDRWTAFQQGKGFRILGSLRDNGGAVVLWVAILFPVFIGFGALAFDISHFLVVRGEVQNASDAGALAGARFLYNNNGTAVNPGANQIAYDAASANTSQLQTVDVGWTSGNTGDVQRGHWSFATRTFTPNNSLAPVNLWNVSSAQLDADPNFINAVRVRAHRRNPQAFAIFGRIFGISGFDVSGEAVAYIGFAGSLRQGEADQPIAICSQALLNNGAYSCTVGRMINSGQNVATRETGGWTSFDQDSPCTGGTNAQQVRSLVCSSGNPEPLKLGDDVATNGGDIQSAFNDLINCWRNATGETQFWPLRLPVINCPGNNVGTCEEVVGAVVINVVWITGAGEDPGYNNAPRQMDSWSNNDPNGQIRWNDFVTHFNLEDVGGAPATYQKKTIYFLPDCDVHVPAGGSGGENFGILARIPVLVQ
jgi:Flp pilus assembly protein TadG